MFLASPTKPRQARTAPSRIELEEARKTVVLDFDETLPELEVEFFYRYLLPSSPLPEGRTVEDVISTLRASKVVYEINGAEGWNGWSLTEGSKVHEDEVFGGFGELTERIREASQIENREPTIEFRRNPTRTPMSITRGNSSRPDCYGVRADAEPRAAEGTGEGKVHWVDIAVAGEFKKNENDAHDVRSPVSLVRCVLSGCHSYLRTW